MKAFFDYFLEVNHIHWGDGPYQWIFYLGIVLILVFEKKRNVRRIVAWVPIAYLVTVFNPLFSKLLTLAGVGDWRYYARMFSFMPLIYVMAHGGSLLINKLQGWLKLTATILICVLIAFTGTNVYKVDWMQPAQNAAKIPNDVYEIRNLFAGSDKRISIATYDPVANYLRQEAPELITPYAREIGDLGVLLTASPVDIADVMSSAGQMGIDYIEIPNDSEEDFIAAGYTPFARLSNSLIYTVTGVSRTGKLLNDRNQVICQWFEDPEGKKKPGNWGYASSTSEYDDNGYIKKIEYFDENGAPFEIMGEYASVEYKNSPRGLVKSEIYRDADLNILYRNGYAQLKYEYDHEGNLTGELYCDENGNPVYLANDFYASKKRQKTGNTVKEWYCDINGNRITCKEGYASIHKVYDEDNRLIAQRYFDLEGGQLQEISAEAPQAQNCMQYMEVSGGSNLEEDDCIHFIIGGTPANQTQQVLFQVFDAVTNEYLDAFGNGKDPGEYAGIYVHQHPDGLYNISFKVDTTKKDENVVGLVYLKQGETLEYNYIINEFTSSEVRISDFHLKRADFSA